MGNIVGGAIAASLGKIQPTLLRRLISPLRRSRGPMLCSYNKICRDQIRAAQQRGLDDTYHTASRIAPT
jgi:hypothetical protein